MASSLMVCSCSVDPPVINVMKFGKQKFEDSKYFDLKINVRVDDGCLRNWALSKFVRLPGPSRGELFSCERRNGEGVTSVSVLLEFPDLSKKVLLSIQIHRIHCGPCQHWLFAVTVIHTNYSHIHDMHRESTFNAPIGETLFSLYMIPHPPLCHFWVYKLHSTSVWRSFIDATAHQQRSELSNKECWASRFSQPLMPSKMKHPAHQVLLCFFYTPYSHSFTLCLFLSL